MIILRQKIFTKCYSREFNTLVNNKFNEWVNYIYEYVKSAHWSIANEIIPQDYKDGLFVKDIKRIDNPKSKAVLSVILKVKSSKLSKYLSEDYWWQLLLDKNNKVLNILFGGNRKFNKN